MGSYPIGIRHDYKDAALAVAARPVRRWPWLVVGLAMPSLAVALILVSTNIETASVPEPGNLFQAVEPPILTGISQDRFDTIVPIVPEHTSAGGLVRMIVGEGDSLDQMFRRNGLSLSDLGAMARIPDAAYYLRMLNPGNAIVATHDAGRVLTLKREIDDLKMLSIVRQSDGFAANIVERPVETRSVGAHGVIQRSLFAASQNAGLSDPITMKMAEIFQWDIDFLQDVRVGDEFTVIYEELWSEGEKLRDGEILAAEFINRGASYRAARYTDKSGTANYFTPDGRSVRKAFIRAPVDFTRISSTFDLSRRHPILNAIRAHRGVDYAAPSGTPVRAAGEGWVRSLGARNGYGNTIVVGHGGNITTLYAHLSRFADIRIGSRIQQGQTIGYVGMSGLATGPHLHYEYRVNGVHRNPQTVALESSEPVFLADTDAFQRSVAGLWHQPDIHRPTPLRATATY